MGNVPPHSTPVILGSKAEGARRDIGLAELDFVAQLALSYTISGSKPYQVLSVAWSLSAPDPDSLLIRPRRAGKTFWPEWTFTWQILLAGLGSMKIFALTPLATTRPH